MKAEPYDYNDPGAIARTVGNYVVDFVGHRYAVIDSTATTITVFDIYRTGQAPQSSQISRCYNSVGQKTGQYVGSVDYSPLDMSARWKLNGADNELLWRQLADPRDSTQYTIEHGDIGWGEGKAFYDTTKHAYSYYNEVDGVTVNMGQENVVRAFNNSVSTIANTIPVYLVGDTFKIASKFTFIESRFIGVVTNPIPPGEWGYATNLGEVGGDYSAFSENATFYLGEGVITEDIPTGGDFNAFIGKKKNDSIMYVSPSISTYTAEMVKPTGWPDADDNGFPDNVGISLGALDRTLILTATPADEYYYYHDGVKYIFQADTFVYSNVEGVHLLYYDMDEINEIINPTDTEYRQVKEIFPGIMNIYHSLTFGTFIFVNNEFHTFDMNGKTKGTFFDIHSCIVIDPIALVDFDIDGTGNLDSHAQYGNLSGTIRNQDIKTVVPATADTVGYSIFYKNGVSDWLRATNAGFGVVTTGTGRIAYNEDVGGSWQLTEATNGAYVYYLLLVSNTLGLKYGTIPGHDSYANEQDAVDAGLADAATILQNLPIKEIAKLALVVYQTRDNYSNSVHGRIVSVTDPITGEDVDYIDLAIPGVGAGQGGSGANTLLDLTDGFPSYAGRGNDILVVNGSEDGFTSIAKSAIPLTDFDSTAFRLTQSQIIGLVDTISNHRTDINLNSASRHDAVTLSGAYDYITLSGQDIIRGQVDYDTDISNTPATLPTSSTWQDVIDNGTATVTNSITTGGLTSTLKTSIGKNITAGYDNTDTDVVNGIFISSQSIAQSSGTWGNGFEFGEFGFSTRKKAAIVPYQYDADADKMGLSIFTSRSGTGGVPPFEMIRITDEIYFYRSLVSTFGADFSGTVTHDAPTLSTESALLDDIEGGTRDGDFNTISGGFTAGSVIFSNGSILTQDNSNFFWDDTNNELGIRTTDPKAPIHVITTIGEATPSISVATVGVFQRNGSAPQSAYISIIGGSTGLTRLQFGDKDLENPGYIQYDNSDNSMSLFVNSSSSISSSFKMLL